MDSAAVPPGVDGGLSARCERFRGGTRIGVRLTWAAAGVAGVAAGVSLVLAVRMDELFAAAVSEGRAFPYTGEAGEQAFFPGVVGCALVVIAVATAALGYMLQGWVFEGHHVGTIVPNVALVVVLAAGAPLGLQVWDLGEQQYTYDLYGWWYVPFLVAAAVAYVCCLSGAAAGLIRR